MTGSESPLINISDESTFFSFDPGLTPIAEVEQNVLVKIETKDCFSNQITSEEQLIMDIDFSRINPATGPVFIKGAKKGDALAVKIHKIDLKQQGAIVTIPEEGLLGDKVKEARTGYAILKQKKFNF